MNFDAAAAGWDTDRRTKRARIIADRIAGAIGADGRMRALEFGCGTGLVSFFLKDRLGRITLVDTSRGMIEVLEQKIREARIGNMTALQMDINACHALEGAAPESAGREGLPDEEFDAVYTSMALHHVREIDPALRALYKSIRKNGRLCIVDLMEEDGSFHKEDKDFDGHNGFNPEQLKSVLEKLGFTGVASEVFYNDIRVIEDRKIPYSLFIMTGTKL
jgi:ubiquinone/menaquinone biosynthesis C-methylase UbiE